MTEGHFTTVTMRQWLDLQIALDRYGILSQRKALCAALGITYRAPDRLEWWMA